MKSSPIESSFYFTTNDEQHFTFHNTTSTFYSTMNNKNKRAGLEISLWYLIAYIYIHFRCKSYEWIKLSILTCRICGIVRVLKLLKAIIIVIKWIFRKLAKWPVKLIPIILKYWIYVQFDGNYMDPTIPGYREKPMMRLMRIILRWP